MSIELESEQAESLARDAYLFGFPLVYIATQIDVLTHVTKPQGARAPLNQFAHYRAFPDASNRTVVGFNVDTLYSLAQLDVSPEPLVLSVPEMGDRFWIMQLLDAWNNVPAAPGSRSVGGKGGDFAIVGPGWEGTLPQGLVELRSPTSLVIVGGRIYTAGPDDYQAVHALQDQLRLVPLSAWGTDYEPPAEVPLKSGVQDAPVGGQVTALSAEDYFNRLNALLVDNPPEPSDPTSCGASRRSASRPARRSAWTPSTPIRAPPSTRAWRPRSRRSATRSPSSASASTAGTSRATWAATARSTPTAQPGRSSAWAATSSRTPSIRSPSSTPTAGARQRQPVRPALQQRATAARRRVLVGHDVRR